MMRGLIIAFALLAVVAGRAAAQPGNTPPVPPTAQPVPPTAYGGPIADERSPGIAFTLSLGATVGSYVLVAAAGDNENEGLSTLGALGTFVAPSFGHWYAGKLWTNGLTLRAAGIGAVMFGAILLLGDCGFEDSCKDSDVAPAVVLLYGGMGAYVGGTILDIATAPGQARTYNERQRERAARTWAIAPTVGHDHAGVVFGGRF